MSSTYEKQIGPEIPRKMSNTIETTVISLRTKPYIGVLRLINQSPFNDGRDIVDLFLEQFCNTMQLVR